MAASLNTKLARLGALATGRFSVGRGSPKNSAPDESRIYFPEHIALKGGFHSNEAAPIPLARRPLVLLCFWPATDFRRTQP